MRRALWSGAVGLFLLVLLVGYPSAAATNPFVRNDACDPAPEVPVECREKGSNVTAKTGGDHLEVPPSSDTVLFQGHDVVPPSGGKTTIILSTEGADRFDGNHLAAFHNLDTDVADVSTAFLTIEPLPESEAAGDATPLGADEDGAAARPSVNMPLLSAYPYVAIVLLAAVSLSLYSRLAPSDVLVHRRRQTILQYLTASPGAHFRKMARDLDMSPGVLTHHLRALEATGAVKSSKSAGRRVFFPKGVRGHVKDLRREIADSVARNPGITQSEVARRLRISRSLAHYHVRALESKEALRIDRNNGSVRMFAVGFGSVLAA